MTTARVPLAIACGLGLALGACRSGPATDNPAGYPPIPRGSAGAPAPTPGGQAAAAYGTSSVAVFTMALQGLLGALMTFAGVAWYPAYGSTTPAWGISPLQDQQLAGMVTWAPASLIYLAATLALLLAWL